MKFIDRVKWTVKLFIFSSIYWSMLCISGNQENRTMAVFFAIVTLFITNFIF